MTEICMVLEEFLRNHALEIERRGRRRGRADFFYGGAHAARVKLFVGQHYSRGGGCAGHPGMGHDIVVMDYLMVQVLETVGFAPM